MSILAEVFVKYWEEVIVAVLVTATLPFIRGYVRRQRAKVLGFLREKERLKQALREAEELAENERVAREEAENNLQAEADNTRKAQQEAENLRATLAQERKAREQAERNLQAEAEIQRKDKALREAKAQNELGDYLYKAGDLEGAVRSYRKAAQHGNTDAQKALKRLGYSW